MAPTEQASTKQDILAHLLRRGQATAQELAAQLHITPQAIRRHLKDLEQEGLIQYVTQSGGMGRPQHLYTLSRKGRAQFPHRYGEFAVDLLTTLHQTLGQEAVGRILAQQWQAKAEAYRQAMGEGDLETRIQRLVQLRRSEGYMAEFQVIPQGFLVTEHICAIAQVAENFPRVCKHELELFATALPDCTVERVQWLVNGQHQCAYLIRPKKLAALIPQPRQLGDIAPEFQLQQDMGNGGGGLSTGSDDDVEGDGFGGKQRPNSGPFGRQQGHSGG